MTVSHCIIIDAILGKKIRLNVANEILASQRENLCTVYVLESNLIARARLYVTSIYIYIFKQRYKLRRRDSATKSPSGLQFCLLRVFFPFPSFPGPSRLRIEVTYQRAGCRSSSDRHVSADFPIKPTEQLSIGGNQRLLSRARRSSSDVGARSPGLFAIALDHANFLNRQFPATRRAANSSGK